MDSNEIIQSLWIGKNMTPMEQLCISSFLQNGHKFHLYAYDDIEDIPQGTSVFDANEILSYKKVFKDTNKLVASFSDWFRYKLLFERGGWWVDMDTVCLKKFDFKEDYCFSTEYCASKKGYCISNHVIKSPARAAFLGEILDYISDIDEHLEVQWGEFGPVLLKLVLQRYDSSHFIKSPMFFCPLIWSGLKHLISNDSRFRISDESFAIHLWNTRWAIEGYNKNGVFPSSSLYEKLKQRYNVYG